MDDTGAFDQSMIDNIVAAAEGDTIESKVANLEEEVTELKGAIKHLLMDIRETMGVLENPFQNIQGIANMSGALLTPQAPSNDEKDEPKEEVEEIDEIDMELMESIPKSSFEDLKQPAVKKQLEKPGNKLLDPLAFHKTIVWSKDMAEKYDQKTIEELVEIFTLLGYIPTDIKDIVIKITEILDKNNNLDSAVMDLYKLYHVFIPEDQSLDSKVLDYFLTEEDTVKDLWQRK